MPAPYPFDDSSSYKNVGLPLKFNNQTDSKNYVINKFIRFMNVVDIVPVHFTFDLGTFDSDSKKFAYNYKFEEAVKEFQKICGLYDLDKGYNGIRCWVTEETSQQDEISHTWSGNMIGDMINSLSTKGNAYANLVRGSAGTFKSGGGDPTKAAGNIAGDAQNIINDMISNMLPSYHDAVTNNETASSLGSGAKEAAKTLFNVGVMGYHAQLPKIWKGSSYSPTLTLSLKLISPYGSPKAIKKYVIDPLLYLLILSSPRTHDGITLGKIPYVYVRAYGVSNINLAIINSVSIRRGGENTVYNQHRQPLTVDVSINISPAVEGFGVVSNPDLTDVATAPDVQYPPFAQSFQPNNAPGFTTLGNIIKSFQRADPSVEFIQRVDIVGEEPSFLESLFDRIPGNAWDMISDIVSGRVDNVFDLIDISEIFGSDSLGIGFPGGDDGGFGLGDLLSLDILGTIGSVASGIGSGFDFLSDSFDTIVNDFPYIDFGGIGGDILSSGKDIDDILDDNVLNPSPDGKFPETDSISDIDPDIPEDLNDSSLKDYQSPDTDETLENDTDKEVRNNLNKINKNEKEKKIENIENELNKDEPSLKDIEKRKDDSKDEIDKMSAEIDDILDESKSEINNKIDSISNMPDSEIEDSQTLNQELNELDEIIEESLDNVTGSVDSSEEKVNEDIGKYGEKSNEISSLKNSVEENTNKKINDLVNSSSPDSDENLSNDNIEKTLDGAFKNNLNSNDNIKNNLATSVQNAYSSISSEVANDGDTPKFQKKLEKIQKIKDELNKKMPREATQIYDDNTDIKDAIDDYSAIASDIDANNSPAMSNIDSENQSIKDSVTNTKASLKSETSSISAGLNNGDDATTIKNNLSNLKTQANNEIENIRAVKNSSASNSKNEIDQALPEQKIQDYNNQFSNADQNLLAAKESSKSSYNNIMNGVGTSVSSVSIQNNKCNVPTFISVEISQNSNSYNNSFNVDTFISSTFQQNNDFLNSISSTIKSHVNSDNKKFESLKKSIDKIFQRNKNTYNQFQNKLESLNKKDFVTTKELQELFSLYNLNNLVYINYSQAEIDEVLDIFDSYFGNYNSSTISGKVKETSINSITQFQSSSEIVSDVLYTKDTALSEKNKFLILILNKTIRKLGFNISSSISKTKNQVDEQIKKDKKKIKNDLSKVKEGVRKKINEDLSYKITDFNIRYKEDHYLEQSRKQMNDELEIFNERLYNYIDSDIDNLESVLNGSIDDILDSKQSSVESDFKSNMENNLNIYLSQNKSKIVKKFKKESDISHEKIKNKYNDLINNKKSNIIQNSTNKLNSLFVRFIYDVGFNLQTCDWSTKLYFYNLYYNKYISLLNNIDDNLSPLIDLRLDLSSINTLIANSNNQVNNKIETEYDNIDVSSIISNSYK